jgi:hypothetical protein
VAGLFDMTSNITAGIRETASDETVIARERLPRFIGRDGILKVCVLAFDICNTALNLVCSLILKEKLLVNCGSKRWKMEAF